MWGRGYWQEFKRTNTWSWPKKVEQNFWWNFWNFMSFIQLRTVFIWKFCHSLLEPQPESTYWVEMLICWRTWEGNGVGERPKVFCFKNPQNKYYLLIYLFCCWLLSFFFSSLNDVGRTLDSQKDAGWALFITLLVMSQKLPW